MSTGAGVKGTHSWYQNVQGVHLGHVQLALEDLKFARAWNKARALAPRTFPPKKLTQEFTVHIC